MRISDWSSDVCSSDLMLLTAVIEASRVLTFAAVSHCLLSFLFCYPFYGFSEVGLCVSSLLGLVLHHAQPLAPPLARRLQAYRSEERRVGKACARSCSSRWLPDT